MKPYREEEGQWWQKNEKSLYHFYLHVNRDFRMKALCGYRAPDNVIAHTERPKLHQRCNTCEKMRRGRAGNSKGALT